MMNPLTEQTWAQLEAALVEIERAEDAVQLLLDAGEDEAANEARELVVAARARAERWKAALKARGAGSEGE